MKRLLALLIRRVAFFAFKVCHIILPLPLNALYISFPAWSA